MKIPVEGGLAGPERDMVIATWRKAARQVALDFGIYVEVGYTSTNMSGSSIDRIYFKVGDYEAESLDELRRALNNKAFL